MCVGDESFPYRKKIIEGLLECAQVSNSYYSNICIMYSGEKLFLRKTVTFFGRRNSSNCISQWAKVWCMQL